LNLHGQVTISWEEDLFVVSAYGPFNEEGLIYCANKLMEQVSSRNLANWKKLEIWDDKTLASPDALKVVKPLFDWYKLKGCELDVFVIKNSVQKYILDELDISNLVIFYDEKEARDWLSKQL